MKKVIFLAVGAVACVLISKSFDRALSKALAFPPESVDDGADEFWIED